MILSVVFRMLPVSLLFRGRSQGKQSNESDRLIATLRTRKHRYTWTDAFSLETQLFFSINQFNRRDCSPASELPRRRPSYLCICLKHILSQLGCWRNDRCMSTCREVTRQIFLRERDSYRMHGCHIELVLEMMKGDEIGLWATCWIARSSIGETEWWDCC